MKNITLKDVEAQQKTELPLFEEPRKKTFETIECFTCKRQAELAGFRLMCVPLCDCCRVEREVEIVNNRFERRRRAK